MSIQLAARNPESDIKSRRLFKTIDINVPYKTVLKKA
jgi:hypothetical protein